MKWFKRFFSKVDKASSRSDDQPEATASATISTEAPSASEPAESNAHTGEEPQVTPTERKVHDTDITAPSSQELPASWAAAESTLKDRHIRVFISSTFSDMQAERELLVKQVFPELRRICAERFVTFTEVDLRWGITEEQAAEGKVLPICLEEIRLCRPYFLGLLGERYGWIPESVPQEVIDREPWLQEHVGGRTSVTELEILHGVLNDPAMEGHAFFFFRDPAYLTSIPENDRANFATEDPESKEKLEKLKDRIRASGLPVLENYANPAALAAAVRTQFIALIDRFYPKETVPDPLDQEAMGHEAYARGKLLAYVERPAHTAALDAFAATEPTGRGLVLTGESGGGKTALLASWVKHWRKVYPSDFVFSHYFGATPESASVPGFLGRLLGELKRRYGITDDVPVQPDKLREVLPLWLAQASACVSILAPPEEKGRGEGVNTSRIILVLDGLNQIEGEDPDRSLAFLPKHFPPRVHVIASALPGPALEAIRERGWAEHLLPPSDKAERGRMIQAFLNHYRKNLRLELTEKLAAAPGAANPLFLRTVLEELRQFGSFEQLPTRVAHYLEAGSPEELFRLVLRRWQEDFDGSRELVCHTLRPLWAARQGLSETEWLELLGTVEQALPRQEWTPLFLAMEPHLAQRSGLYAFSHDFLRQAVQIEFLPSEDDRRTAHLALADYFESQPAMTPRKAAEWPWQLHAAEAWERLEACLTDRELFVALYDLSEDRTKWELPGYWHPLRARGGDMGRSYALVFDRWVHMKPAPVPADYLSYHLGSFLNENGCYPEAESLLRYSVELSAQVLGSDHPNTLSCLASLAHLFLNKKNISEADPLARSALMGRERVLGKDHPETIESMSTLAVVFQIKGEYGEAESLLRSALELSEQVLGKDHRDTVLRVHNLAAVLESKGDYLQAECLYRRALKSFERIMGKDHPSTVTTVNGLAGCLSRRRVYDEGELLYRRALESFERLLGKDHPSTLTTVHNLASLLESIEHFGEAEPLFRRALEGRERVLGPEHPDTLTSVSSLAVLLQNNGEDEEAEPLFRRALEGRERVLGQEHPHTLAGLNNLAFLLEIKGNYREAEPLYWRALESCEKVLGPDHPDTLTSVSNLGLLLKTKGEYVKAEPLLRRALASREQVLGLGHRLTLTSLNNMVLFLLSKGDYEQTKNLYRQALENCERVLGPEHPSTLERVQNLADLLANTGDYGEAKPLYWRALESSERVLGPEHPSTLERVQNLALFLDNMEDYGEAEPLYRRALKGRERVLGPEHPSTLTTMNNLALLLYNIGHFGEAEPLYRRALERSQQVLGPEHPTTLTLVANLALLLNKKGNPEEAEPLYRRALKGRERVLGPEHPDTPMTMHNLAVLLTSKGDYEKAEPLHRRAVLGITAIGRAMGGMHPYLPIFLANYKHCLQGMGLTEAEIRAKTRGILG